MLLVFSESLKGKYEVEAAALEILSDLGYKILHGPDIAPDGTSTERQSVGEKN
jgi:hypothetical protein